MVIYKKFIVCVPYCEVYKPFFIKCLTSLESQNYYNFEVVIIVDGYLSDLTEIYTFIENKNNYKILIFKENTGPAFSKWKFIEYIQNNIDNYSYNDIVCIVDGDDYLENNAFHILNDIFQKNNCWVTFGSAVGNYCDISIPDNFTSWENIRKEKWIYSHLRCYKLHLLLNFIETL